jgi:ribulose-phosphate 3-epimerase
MVLLMSVNPGFSGQKFIEHTYIKLNNLNMLKNRLANFLDFKIQIDGGVSLENFEKLKSWGADVLVAGNAVFKSDNPIETIKKLKNGI